MRTATSCRRLPAHYLWPWNERHLSGNRPVRLLVGPLVQLHDWPRRAVADQVLQDRRHAVQRHVAGQHVSGADVRDVLLRRHRDRKHVPSQLQLQERLWNLGYVALGATPPAVLAGFSVGQAPVSGSVVSSTHTFSVRSKKPPFFGVLLQGSKEPSPPGTCSLVTPFRR